MPASLFNQNISNTFRGLLHAQGDSLPTTGKIIITDGYGQNSALSLGVSNQGINVTGPSVLDDVTADSLTLSGSLFMSGELNVDANSKITAINAPKAWAIFSGNDGTLRAGYNVSAPIARSTVGEYQITFTQALSSDKYVVQTNLACDNTGATPFMVCSHVMSVPVPTASTFWMRTLKMPYGSPPVRFDPETVSITVYHA